MSNSWLDRTCRSNVSEQMLVRDCDATRGRPLSKRNTQERAHDLPRSAAFSPRELSQCAEPFRQSRRHEKRSSAPASAQSNVPVAKVRSWSPRATTRRPSFGECGIGLDQSMRRGSPADNYRCGLIACRRHWHPRESPVPPIHAGSSAPGPHLPRGRRPAGNIAARVPLPVVRWCTRPQRRPTDVQVTTRASVS